LTIIGATLAFVFLDPPWRYLVIAALLLIDVAEIFIWLRWRKRKSITGVENIVDARGEVVSDCTPDGQVKVRGQIWSATCAEGARAGDAIVVTEVSGIRLTVARAPAPSATRERSAPPVS
jgi:membrane protein implicated in regulation of membrane protease activity